MGRPWKYFPYVIIGHGTEKIAEYLKPRYRPELTFAEAEALIKEAFIAQQQEEIRAAQALRRKASGGPAVSEQPLPPMILEVAMLLRQSVGDKFVRKQT